MVNKIKKNLISNIMRASYFTNPDRVGKDVVRRMEKNPLLTCSTYVTNELLRRLKGASSLANKSDDYISAAANFLFELFGPETPISSLVKLLEMPSVTGHEEHKAKYLSSILMTFGIESWVDRYGNVIGIIRGSSKETVLYEIHMDVVPPEEGQKVYIKDGRVWGRGSSDAQAGISEILYAAKRLATFSRFYPLKRNLLIVLDSGEEATTSEAKGFLRFINSFKKGRIKRLKGLRIWAGVCGEPTSDDSGKICIGVSSAGRVLMRIKISGEKGELQKAYGIHLLGQSCHAAQPWKGLSVFQGMKSITSYLNSRGCEIVDAQAGAIKDGIMSPSVTNIIPSHGYISVNSETIGKTNLRKLVRAWHKKNSGFRVVSIEDISVPSSYHENSLETLRLIGNIMKLNRGLKTVQIAGVNARPTCAPTYLSLDAGYMLVDFRIVANNTPEDARRMVESTINRKAEIISSNRAAYTQSEDFLKMLEGRHTKRVHVFYSHMLSYLQKELMVKRIFVVSGGCRENLHTPDENAEISMIIKSAHFLYSSLKRMCY
ncbi:MAG: M20/M25/M40 family metallo-hydrolase [Candidatus Micrarchaeota archaeon]